jgi:hypothetical protein
MTIALAAMLANPRQELVPGKQLVQLLKPEGKKRLAVDARNPSIKPAVTEFPFTRLNSLPLFATIYPELIWRIFVSPKPPEAANYSQ